MDAEEVKKKLLAKEAQKKEQWEKERKAILQTVIEAVKEEFKDAAVEIYLVGSVVRPFQFSPRSDVDIVLRHFQGDRFDVWTRLEEKIGRSVEIIVFEKCHFQDFVLEHGFRVV